MGRTTGHNEAAWNRHRGLLGEPAPESSGPFAGFKLLGIGRIWVNGHQGRALGAS